MVITRFQAQLVPKLLRTSRSIRQYSTAHSGSTQRTRTIDVLHHWLAATVIPKPLTSAIPATHMPSPFMKPDSLGTVARTAPSPPASQAQPARPRGRRAGSSTPAPVGASPSSLQPAPIQGMVTPEP